MATHINGQSIKSQYINPVIGYVVTYTSSRSNNSQATYDFTIKSYMYGSSAALLGTGYILTAYITINGVQKSVVLKAYSDSWSGGSSAGNLKATTNVSITCPSTSGDSNQTVTFQVVNKSSYADGVSGEVNTSDYYVISPALLSTACTAPTNFTASSDNFDSNVTLTWSGAGSGINQPIVSYLIRYTVSSDNSTWGNWIDLQTVSSTDTSGSLTIDMSAKVSRGYYVKFAIRTQPSNTSYISGWTYSASIRRKPYTVCGAPTAFTVDSNNFETSITLSWSGASSGTNNSINSYYIQYCISSDNSAWGSWYELQSVSTTQTSYSLSIDVSSKVTRGKYIKFRIRTQGSAGSSYYSAYKESNSVRRNPYTKCGAPTNVKVTSESDVNGITHNDTFKTSITISWSAGTAGENNAIQRYYIEYCTSSNNSDWSSWIILQSSDLTPVGTTSTTVDVSSIVNIGDYIKIHIRTEGVAGSSYYSEYVSSSSIRRNSSPIAPTIFDIQSHPSLEYSYGENIVLSWNDAVDDDDNVNKYILYARITTDGVWGVWEAVNTSIGKSTLSYIIESTSDLYKQVSNNEQIQFGIKAVDVFNEPSLQKYSSILTRYDITGVAIGINNKWVNCQIFVGENGVWAEKSVSAGINNTWVDADGIS